MKRNEINNLIDQVTDIVHILDTMLLDLDEAKCSLTQNGYAQDLQPQSIPVRSELKAETWKLSWRQGGTINS